MNRLYCNNKSCYSKLLKFHTDTNTSSNDTLQGGKKKKDMKSKDKSKLKSKSNTDSEIEYKFYGIDTNILRKKLKQLKATMTRPKIIMPLITFTHPTKIPDSYIRIRDEGNRITMTSKTNLKSEFVTEHEVVIDNFAQGVKLLKSLGCEKKYYVEKLRETWVLLDTEIVIDSYPGTPEYAEIEGSKLADVKKVTRLLGLKPTKERYDIYYETYGAPKDRKQGGDLTFKNALEKFDGMIFKNMDLFKKTLKEQQKYYDNFKFDINDIK